MLVAIPGDDGPVDGLEIILEYFIERGVVFGTSGVNVVAPELRAVVLRGLAADVAVAHVDIGIPVVIKIDGHAPPGPARASHPILKRRLPKGVVRLGQVHPVAVAHFHPHIL